MPESTDQLGRTVRLQGFPERIVSIVPSQTELLCALGLHHRLAGRTKFCIHPMPALSSVSRVGGTKNLSLEKIRRLTPDLIIANKEENDKHQVEKLAADFPVWVSDVKDIANALAMITGIGTLTGAKEAARVLADGIQSNFDALPRVPLQSCVYMIWKEPWMCAGPDTFISSMLPHAGFSNRVNQPRYPTLTTEALRQLNPETVLLSSEPYPFTEKHLSEVRRLLPDSRVLLVDGTYFSWYGSRLLHAPEYFGSLRP